MKQESHYFSGGSVNNQKVKQKKFDESEILVRAIAEEELQLIRQKAHGFSRWDECLPERIVYG